MNLRVPVSTIVAACVCRAAGAPSCLCHAPDDERARHGLPPRVVAAKEEAADPGRVVLAKGVSRIQGGLEIAGIASTRGWGVRRRNIVADEKAFQLDGAPNVLETRGVDPMRPSERIYLPSALFWHHDRREPIGELTELSADPDAIYFRAIVAPPDTAGMDSALLAYIWSGIRERTVSSVSFTCDYRSDGGWRPFELSVCHRGAHPAARILSARYPDGESWGWPAPEWTEAQIRNQSIAHRAAWEERRQAERERERGEDVRAELEAVRAELETLKAKGAASGAAMRYAGVWREGATYRVGEVVTHRGLLWHANTGTAAMPGSDHSFTMMLKSEEHR